MPNPLVDALENETGVLEETAVRLYWLATGFQNPSERNAIHTAVDRLNNSIKAAHRALNQVRAGRAASPNP